MSRVAYKEECLIPICTHFFLEETCGVNEKQDKELLLMRGKDILGKCEVILINVDNGISSGMRSEINYARKKGIMEVFYRNDEIKYYIDPIELKKLGIEWD